MKTILVAVDSSGIADSVVAEAGDLARTAQARVILLTVVQPPIISSEYVPMFENIAEITAAGEKAAETHLQTLQNRLKAGGVETVGVRVTGAPIARILEQARQHAADYIVMGSHGHTALYDLLVGSTTHGVLLRAPCPVVIVPARDRKEREAK